jgi:O-antigen/teichoic acid export membrane protein
MALIGGRQILTILYRPEYAEHAELFCWLMFAAAITYVVSFLNDGMVVVRYFKIQLPLYALIILVSTVMSFWLIPTHGLKGAAFAVISAKAVQAVFGFAIIGHALIKSNNNK